MRPSAFTSDPVVVYLQQLLEEIRDGELLIPRFQRPFVWQDEQRLELLRSIRDGTPVGSILVWRTSRADLRTFERMGPHRLPAPEPGDERHRGSTRETGRTRSYVLDGHQRLSTLYGALIPLVSGSRRPEDKLDEDKRAWAIYYNLRDKDFEIIACGPVPSHMLPLDRVLDSVALLKFQRTLGDLEDADDLVGAADDLTTGIRQYKIPVIPIATDDLERATTTFQRINSQGTTMSQVHMVNALTWQESFDFNEWIEQRQDTELAAVGWQDLEPKTLLNVCKALLGLDVYEKNPDAIADTIRTNGAAFDGTIGHLIRAIQFLQRDCGIGSPDLLPYSHQLVLLAAAFQHVANDDADAVRRLRRWFWYTTYTGWFQGINSSRLREAHVELKKIAAGTYDPAGTRWPMQPLADIAQLPPRFDFRAARNRALALRLAELDPRDSSAGAWGAVRELTERGADVIHTLIDARRLDRLDASARRGIVSAPANRVLSRPEDLAGLRRRLLDEPPTDSALRESHAIGATAALALEAGEYALFVEERTRDLQALEQAFVEREGLTRPDVWS